MEKCEFVVGIFTPHPCRKEKANQCSECAKALCSEHVGFVEGQPFCPACSHKHNPTEYNSDQADHYICQRESYGSWYNNVRTTLITGAALGITAEALSEAEVFSAMDYGSFDYESSDEMDFDDGEADFYDS